MSSASWLRARSLLRRYALATVLLGVFAGLAGGAALGVWGTARRTSTAYDRFVTDEGAADLTVFGCPPDVTLEQTYDPDFDFQICQDYDYADVRQHLAEQPGIESTGPVTLVIAGISPLGDPARFTRALVDVVLGRVARTAIVDGIGIVSPPALPGSSIVLVAVVILAVANLAALGPGWAAARTRPATALRTE